MQRMYPPYWPSVCRILRETQVGASDFFDSERMSNFLFLPVERTIRQGIQWPLRPVPTATQVVSASTSLIKVVGWDGTSQDIKQELTAAFDAKDYLDCIKNLRAQNIEPLSYINSLDKVGSCPTSEGTPDSPRFPDRLLTAFESIQIYGSDAYER